MSGDFYRFIQGIGDNWDYVLDFLSKLAKLRNPYQTTILSDLEKEYGINTDNSLSDSIRREYLASLAYAPKGTGSSDYLQTQLNKAGFDVQVHINTPSVDPGAFIGGNGGELITNTAIYDRSALEARFSRPHWGYVFFIGGDATRDSYGRITNIDNYPVSASRKASFRNIVLKHKPLHSWAVAVINDADYFQFASGDFAEASTTKGFSDDDQTSGGLWYDIPKE